MIRSLLPALGLAFAGAPALAHPGSLLDHAVSGMVLAGALFMGGLGLGQRLTRRRHIA